MYQNPHVGNSLREWRRIRHLSQLELALKAGLSPRHLSFIETGRAQPSAHMLLRLADGLEMSLRERNGLLIAGGYAPRYRESGLHTPELENIQRAVSFIFQQQEPYPAFLVSRHWDIVSANAAAAHVVETLMEGSTSVHDNMIRQVFDPAALRRAIVNWEEVAGDLIRHLHAAVASSPNDATTRGLLEEALAFPGVPTRWRKADVSLPPSPVLTTIFRARELELRFFSTTTTFASVGDVTLQELHIESCFPMDAPTMRFCHELGKRKQAASAALLLT